MVLTVACIKVGDKYPPEYVNKLHNMVKRHLYVDHDFICITDNPEGVECKTLPVEEDLPGWWSKLTLFRKKAYGLERVLFFDLDVVITGDLIPLAWYTGDFAIIKDWNVPTYNSSVFNLRIGSRVGVWNKFSKNKERMMKIYPGDQDVITQFAKADLWPEGLCTSFKRDPTPSGIVSVFHGDPKPDVLGGWVKDYWV